MSQFFLLKWMPLQKGAFCPCSSGIPVQRYCTLRPPFVPVSGLANQFFRLKWMPPQRCTFDPVALTFQSHTLARSGLQLCPPQCAQASFSDPNGCRFRSALLILQLWHSSAALCTSWSPSTFLCFIFVGFVFLAVPFKIALVPLSAAICAFHLLSIAPSCQGRSPFQACPRLSFSQRACRSAPVNQPLDLTFPWEAPAFAPIFAQRAIELQAVPSIQLSSRPLMRAYWGPVLPSYWMRHYRAQQPSASLTFWRGSLCSSSFESLPLPPCVRAPYGTH